MLKLLQGFRNWRLNMDRKQFLQNIFGAAVVAAMPKIVVAQINAIAPRDIIPLKKSEPIPANGLYIYDKNQLIAASTLFTVNSERQSFNTNLYLPIISPRYDCKICVEKLRWFNGLSGRDLIESNEPLKCLMYCGDVKIEGNVLLTECALTFDMEHEIEEDVTLTVIGNIIIDTNERPNLTK